MPHHTIDTHTSYGLPAPADGQRRADRPRPTRRPGRVRSPRQAPWARASPPAGAEPGVEPSSVGDGREGAPPSGGPAPETPRRLVVYYDEGCGPCTATARVLERLNWLGWVGFREAATYPEPTAPVYEDIHAVRRDGRVFRGFATYQQIAWRLPPLWLAAPWLHVWPITWLGRRVYRRIADARRCDLRQGGNDDGPPGA